MYGHSKKEKNKSGHDNKCNGGKILIWALQNGPIRFERQRQVDIKQLLANEAKKGDCLNLLWQMKVKGHSITVHPKKLVTFDRYDDSDREEYFSEVGPIPVTDP